METVVLNLDSISNFEKIDGKICLKKIDATHTPKWCNGWYKNPTSGRSNNFGIMTESPQDHYTIVVKGGSFYVNEKIKRFCSAKNSFMNELHGGIAFDMAKREYDIAVLIQEKFQSLLGKKANCPQPIDLTVTPYILNEKGVATELVNFFEDTKKIEYKKKIKFTASNIISSAMKLGIDIYYPMSEGVSADVKKDPFRWVFKEYFDKSQQGVYRYKIDGPNTRLLDLMTLKFSERCRCFIEANNSANIKEALEIFCLKLGEFYGVLHKSSIGFHSGFSEHCTLADITIVGVVMDIGGLSEDTSEQKKLQLFLDSFLKIDIANDSDELSDNKSVKATSEEYFVQMFKTTNLISYLCKNIFKTDDVFTKKALGVFWYTYQSIYSDANTDYLSKEGSLYDVPDKIRTRYLDHLSGGLIKLAPDLKDLNFD